MKVKKAFTLVELLVVISIIALLLSIMIPSLQKAREIAKKTVCMSNMHQLIVAVSLYQGANELRFPAASAPGYSDDLNATLTYTKWGGNRGKESSYDSADRLLNCYVGVNRKVDYSLSDRSLGVYLCPSDKGGYGGVWARWGGIDRLPSLHYWFGYSYNYNSDGMSNSAEFGLWGKKITDIRSPFKAIVLSDGSMAAFAYGCDPCFQYRYWHHQKELAWGNAAFVDGHVDYFRASRRAGRANVYWWKGKNWTFGINK